MSQSGTLVRIATYNVHKCRGLDYRTRVDRVAEVLRATGAQVVAVQEVLGQGRQDAGQAEELGARLGMGWVMASARHHRGRLYGNVVMSDLPIVGHAQYDLSWHTREPRCCLRADIQLGRMVMHVYNVHLGTALAERQYQAGRLATFVHDRRTRGPKLVLGDFNEWTLGITTKLLRKHFQSVDAPAPSRRIKTFPGFLPVFPLDHIYFDPALKLKKSMMHRTPAARMASDHLPMVAEFEM